jgi:uncharacterized protein YndB with AHSA1/START domain
MSKDDGVDIEVEVPGTPEQVWDAIATGPGISAWFMPAEVTDTTITHHHAPGQGSEAKITAFEPPHRLAFTEGPGGAMATEFLVEARSGGTCVVRLVTSGYGDKSASDGWTAALLSLRLYLEHFPGQRASVVIAGGTVPGPVERAWEELVGALGLERLTEGERVEAAGPGAPPLAGVVEGRLDTMATLRLDSPAPGLAFVGVGGPDDETVFAFVRAQFFGPDAPELAARHEPELRALLERERTAGR